MDGAADIAGLLGQIVKLKARNIRAAQWETGILERLELDATEESFAIVRMRDKQPHKISLRDFIVEKR